MIVVSYGSDHLRQCCSLAEAAEQEFGQVYAQAVLTLIADVEALDDGGALIDYYGPAVTIEPDDSLLVRIGANCAARFAATGTRVSLDRGRVIWTSVQRLKFMEVVKW